MNQYGLEGVISVLKKSGIANNYIIDMYFGDGNLVGDPE